MTGIQPTLGKHKPLSEDTLRIRKIRSAYRRRILKKSGINKPNKIIV